jgi:hypothetical protein
MQQVCQLPNRGNQHMCHLTMSYVGGGGGSARLRGTVSDLPVKKLPATGRMGHRLVPHIALETTDVRKSSN